MAEATTGNNLSGLSQNTGIVSRISTSISNVRKITSDPAVQKSIPLIFGVIVAFIGLIVFFTMQKSDMTTLFASTCTTFPLTGDSKTDFESLATTFSIPVPTIGESFFNNGTD